MDVSGANSTVEAAQAWSPLVAVWMFGCIAVGQLLWRKSTREVRVAPSRFTLSWRDSDEYLALVVLVAVAVACGWQSWVIAATGDESSNIEPQFWSNWYMAWESRSSPPLFRTVIHILAPIKHRFVMRLPALAAGVGALALLYQMLRRRASTHVAQWLLVAVAGSALILGYSIEQKSYTLWLLLLLGCHRAAASALRGRRTMWAQFSLLAALAMLTHYLSIAWLFGYVLWAWWESREDLKDVVLALLPGALAVAPMALPILTLDEPVSEGPGAHALSSWLQASAPAALIPGGIVGAAALFLLRPIEHVRGTHMADAALPFLLATGIVGAVLAATGGAIHARFLMPVLPISALAAAGRMPRPMRDWNRNDRAILAFVALLSIATGFARIGPVAVATASNPVQRALQMVADRPPPKIRIVQPPWTLHVALYEASGERDMLHGAQGDELLRWSLVQDGIKWGTLRLRPTVDSYDKVLATYGEFELWSLAGPEEPGQPAPIEAWTGGHCVQTVRIGNPDRTIPGPWAHVWRCRAKTAGNDQSPRTAPRAPAGQKP